KYIGYLLSSKPRKLLITTQNKYNISMNKRPSKCKDDNAKLIKKIWTAREKPRSSMQRRREK
ncbi:MAG: hypothetical protein OXU23_18460, partial [Candidatus Poribacteria bacterium]|nr:hypothetical protein [Candidatus Poribacteria bacterium]